MIRSLSRINKELFSRLIEYNKSSEYPITSPEAGRWIKRSQSDIDLVKQADYGEREGAIYSVSYAKCVRFETPAAETVAAFLWPYLPEAAPHGLEEIEEPTVGQYFAAYHSLLPDIRASEVEIYNTINNEHSWLTRENGEKVQEPIEPEYLGTELAPIAALFQKIYFFRIIDRGLSNWPIERLFGYVAVYSHSNFPLRHPGDLIECYKELFLSGSDFIPYDEVSQSLFASHWKYAFLELYRCIEQVFPSKVFGDIVSMYSIQVGSLEFAKTFEGLTSWRPAEKGCIDGLFAMLGEDAIDRLRIALGESTDAKLPALTKKFYDLRNKIVHYRRFLGELNIGGREYCLIKFTLLAVLEIYMKLEMEGGCFDPPTRAPPAA